MCFLCFRELVRQCCLLVAILNSHHLRHIRDNSGIARVVDYVSDKEIHVTTVVSAGYPSS